MENISLKTTHSFIHSKVLDLRFNFYTFVISRDTVFIHTFSIDYKKFKDNK